MYSQLQPPLNELKGEPDSCSLPPATQIQGPLLTHQFSGGGPIKTHNIIYLFVTPPPSSVEIMLTLICNCLLFPQRLYQMCVNKNPPYVVKLTYTMILWVHKLIQKLTTKTFTRELSRELYTLNTGKMKCANYVLIKWR